MISRAQAKRVLAQIKEPDQVVLDFKGITDIGQGFSDELFRVFAQRHPEIRIMYVNANESVEWMIQRVLSSH